MLRTTVIPSVEGVAKSLKALNHKEHNEDLFFSFVVFVPLWFKAFMLFVTLQERRYGETGNHRPVATL